MRIPRIYTPQTLNIDTCIDLDDNSAHHVAKVLRMQAGRPLVLFNGKGGEYNAVIQDVTKKNVTVKIELFVNEQRESLLAIHLGIGLSRGERFDWVLQKATELGVASITPLFTERCEVKLTGPRLEKKQQHWEQIIIAACEQCQRNGLPKLLPAQKLETWLGHLDSPSKDGDLRFVLHHRSEKGLSHFQAPQSVTLVIGPEGGLSETEIKDCNTHHFAPLTLGPRVMRTETAPVSALSIFQYLWGDLSL